LIAGGAALAAVGADVGGALPAPAAITGAVPAPAVGLAATPTPTPTSDPVSTVLGAVGTAVDTATTALGLGPKPTPTTSHPVVNPGTGTGNGTDPGSGTAVTPPRPRVPRPQVHPAGGPGSLTSGPLGSFGASLGDRRPPVTGVAGPVQGRVHGIGAIAAPPLSPSAEGALGDKGTSEDTLPGLLVVCAAACVAAAAAGNAEVWRRRLADKLA
jgi:hypothetical protein